MVIKMPNSETAYRNELTQISVFAKEANCLFFHIFVVDIDGDDMARIRISDKLPVLAQGFFKPFDIALGPHQGIAKGEEADKGAFEAENLSLGQLLEFGHFVDGVQGAPSLITAAQKIGVMARKTSR